MTEEALKARLGRRGLRVPAGSVVTAGSGPVPDSGPAMVKALVPVTDRAGRGLVVRADDAHQVRDAVARLLTRTVDGHAVERVLVESVAAPGEEYYLAAGVDHATGTPVLLYGPGGSGIEHREVGPVRYPFTLGSPEPFTALPDALQPVAAALVAEFELLGALLVELNPVRVDGNGDATVLDAKASLDPAAPVPDDAMDLTPPDEAARRLQRRARDLPGGTEVRFGRLPGTVGLVSAGGGVLNLVHDALRGYGLAPANFADVSGGSASTELLGAVAEEVAALKPAGVLIVTGITSSVSVTGFAEAMVAALGGLDDGTPIVARMAGAGEEEAAVIMSALPDCRTVGKDFTVDEAVDLLAGLLAGVR